MARRAKTLGKVHTGSYIIFRHSQTTRSFVADIDSVVTGSTIFRLIGVIIMLLNYFLGIIYLPLATNLVSNAM
jgi:hypothetical protein